MESEIDWDELEREIDEALIDSAPAPRSPTARIGQKRRATADEKSDPTSPLDLCASFAEFVKAKGLPRPVSDSAHRCRVSECSYFRRGTHFVCLKTGRLHRCSATECTEKKAPSAIPLNGDGYVLRQRDGEVCPVTGETFALDPQLDFHQECLVESGAAEAEDSVAAGQVTKARKKEVKRDTRPTINERRKRQIRETIEEILLPEKKSEWGPHRPDLVLRVANLLSLLKDEGNPPRYVCFVGLCLVPRLVLGRTPCCAPGVERAFVRLCSRGSGVLGRICRVL